jgi:hypothetical protein
MLLVIEVAPFWGGMSEEGRRSEFPIPRSSSSYLLYVATRTKAEKSPARRIAVARPIPWLAPVTMATDFDIAALLDPLKSSPASRTVHRA